MFQGLKTYIVAILIMAASILRWLGVIDNNTYELLMGMLVAGGFSALRAGISKV